MTLPTQAPKMPYSQMLLRKNGSITPNRSQGGTKTFQTPTFPTPASSGSDALNYLENMPFVRYVPGQGLVTETNQQSAERGDIVGQLQRTFNENKVDLIVGIIGVLLVILALAQIVKPI